MDETRRFAGRRILLGITGGIAVYKSCELVRALVKGGAEVQVLMTENATRFVAPLTFETLSQRPVRITEFDPQNFATGHIEIARWGTLMLVAPATANTLAQMAHGLAGSLLTTVYLAFDGPVCVAPAMNTVMVEHPATRANLELLASRGVTIIPPRVSELACGEVGAGAMAEIPDILAAIEKIAGAAKAPAGTVVTPVTQYGAGPATTAADRLIAVHTTSATGAAVASAPVRDLEGIRVLITGGATREYLDPVRFLSNPSSGRMAAALAAVAQRRGAAVTLVHGSMEVFVPPGVKGLEAVGVLDMRDAVMSELPRSDWIIGAAAVGDFLPAERSTQKIKKPKEGGLTLELTRAPDILAEVGRARRPGQVVVGFAAETENLLENARSKLVSKGADMIVANDVSKSDRGFGTVHNTVTLVTRDEGHEDLPDMPKEEVASKILDWMKKRKREI